MKTKKNSMSRRNFLKQTTKITAGGVLGSSLLADLAQASTQKFKGKIAKRYEDSAWKVKASADFR